MALNFCNNNSLSAITTIPASISGGGLNLISTQTASGNANISITSGIDSTYKEYIIKCIGVHLATNDARFDVNFSSDGGSNYNVTKTTSAFRATHSEDGSGGALGYETGQDLAQSTGVQSLCNCNNGNDDNINATIHLFDPSDTTFVKHFIATVNTNRDAAQQQYIAGYCNTTSAVNAVQFGTSSGNIDAGTFKLYGVS